MGLRRKTRETPKLKGQTEKNPERESESYSQRIRRETRYVKYHRGQEKADCGQQRQVLSWNQIRKRLRSALGEHLLARSRVSGSRSWTNETNECRQLFLEVCLKNGRYNPWVFFSKMGKWGHHEGSLTTFYISLPDHLAMLLVGVAWVLDRHLTTNAGCG